MKFTHSSSSVEELCRIGVEFLDQRRFAEAEWQFTQAKDRAPDSPEVYYCIGLLFADLGRPGDALLAFDRAISLSPTHAKAHNNRGSALQQLGKLPDAEAAFRRALELAPNLPLPYINLANVVDQQYRTSEALKVYDLALSRDVDSELIGQYRASLLGKATSRAPDSWVRATFDNFAPVFDEHLTSLNYVVPTAMVEMLEEKIAPGSRVLDLGCGTGWVGAAFGRQDLHIHGVDLSERMLIRARERGVYERLWTKEIHEFLHQCESSSYDLVCAADVFIYIGLLDKLFQDIRRVLSPKGLFAFSIEETNGLEYALQNTGRYAHSRAYIRRLAGFRFEIIDDRPGAIRQERGAPLQGRVYLAAAI